MAFVAFTVLVFLLEPGMRRRKSRRQFDALAQAMGKQPPATRALPSAARIDGPAFRGLLDRTAAT